MTPSLVYSLKRRYSARVDVYRLASSTTNVFTGERVVTKEVYPLERAIVLPAKVSVQSDIAPKGFNYGAYYDKSVRNFIIDRSDLPIELSKDDWLVLDGCKYEIKQLEVRDAAYLIIGQDTGETPQQIHVLFTNTYLTVEHGSESELE